jgi:hypothetical protein
MPRVQTANRLSHTIALITEPLMIDTVAVMVSTTPQASRNGRVCGRSCLAFILRLDGYTRAEPGRENRDLIAHLPGN